MVNADQRHDRSVAGPATSRSTEFPGPADDDHELSNVVADTMVRRLFGVGLDLHAALTYIEEGIAKHVAVEKIHNAIIGLDDTITDFRGAVFNLQREGPAQHPPGCVRALIVDAVERACGGTAAYPAVTLRGGIEADDDPAAGHRLARMVYQVLILLPHDRLGRSRVELTADPGPPARLVVDIEVPVADLSGVACRVGSMCGRRLRVTAGAVTGPPGHARIRIECPTGSA